LASGDADDCGERVGVGERLGGQAQAEASGVALEQEQFAAAQWAVFVGESDPAVELGVAGQATL